MKRLLILFLAIVSFQVFGQNPGLNNTVRNNPPSAAKTANALDASKPFTASGTNTYSITTGTSAYTGATTYAIDDMWTITITNSNSSTTTSLNVDSEGAISLKDASGSDLKIGSMKAGGTYTFRYNGTVFRMVGGGSGSESLGSDNEVQTSDGSGGFVASKLFFDETTGNMTIGDGTLSGGRVGSVASSSTNAALTWQSKGTGVATLRSPSGIANIVGLSNMFSSTTSGTHELEVIGATGITKVRGRTTGDVVYYEGVYDAGGDSGDVFLKSADPTTTPNSSTGNVYITSGAKHGSGTVGNVGLFTLSTNFQSMEKGMFIGNATTNPIGNPTSGGFLYADGSDASKPKWKVPGGTTYDLTTIADGDKGDITVSSSGSVWTVDNNAITNAKINDVAASKITGILSVANGGTGVSTGAYLLASGGTASGTNTFAMGSNPFIMTTSVSTGTGATAGHQLVGNSLTTGNLLDVSSSSSTTGFLAKFTSTSTVINHITGSNALVGVISSGANSTPSKVTTGLLVGVSNSGTTSTNYGIYTGASGATTNFALGAKGTAQLENNASATGLTINGGVIANYGGNNVTLTVTGGDLTLTTNQTGTIQTVTTLNLGNSSTINSVAKNFTSITGGYSQIGTGGDAAGINFANSYVQTTITSGTHNYRSINIAPTYNQTVSMTGTMVGIRYAPTITSLALTHYAWYSSSGSFLIGNSTSDALTADTRMDIRGTGTGTGFSLRLATSANTERFGFFDDGRFYGTAIHNNGGSMTGTTNQYIGSGTYTPTLSNTTNVGASTAYVCQWDRVGNTVTVSGKVSIDATAAVATELGMSLPIASAFTVEEDLGGTASSAVATTTPVAIRSDATNDRASLVFTAVSLSNDDYFFTFKYLIK